MRTHFNINYILGQHKIYNLLKKKVKYLNFMITSQRVSIVIPCYNEEESILNLTNQLNSAVADLEKDYETELIFC